MSIVARNVCISWALAIVCASTSYAESDRQTLAPAHAAAAKPAQTDAPVGAEAPAATTPATDKARSIVIPLNLSLPGAGIPAGAPTDEVLLPGVIVHGRRDVLSDRDRRLAALKGSLPCIGCDHQAPPSLDLSFVAQALLPVKLEARDVTPEDNALHESQWGLCTPDNRFGCLLDGR